MADTSVNKFNSEKQGQFASNAQKDLESVWGNPRDNGILTEQAGEPDEKSLFARKTLRTVALQLTFAMLMAYIGMNAKGMDNLLLHPFTLFGSFAIAALTGIPLLLHKHIRANMNQGLPLLWVFSITLSMGIASLMANSSYNHMAMIVLFSATVAVDCQWFSLHRNKSAHAIQKHLVVGTMMALLISLCILAYSEHNTKDAGQISASLYMLVGLAATFFSAFYVGFFIMMIALVEFDDFEDWILASIHVYLDILKAIWIGILTLINKIVA